MGVCMCNTSTPTVMSEVEIAELPEACGTGNLLHGEAHKSPYFKQSRKETLISWLSSDFCNQAVAYI